MKWKSWMKEQVLILEKKKYIKNILAAPHSHVTFGPSCAHGSQKILPRHFDANATDIHLNCSWLSWSCGKDLAAPGFSLLKVLSYVGLYIVSYGIYREYKKDMYLYFSCINHNCQLYFCFAKLKINKNNKEEDSQQTTWIKPEEFTHRSHRPGTRLTKGALRSALPSPPGWRNEPLALSHPFPACTAPACSATEPPCCRSETLGCRRETGAEIRDHPPSPPVSTVSVSVGIGQGALNSRTGWILSPFLAWKGKDECFMRLERLPLVLASFLPPVVSVFRSRQAHGPLLASASREPVGL